MCPSVQAITFEPLHIKNFITARKRCFYKCLSVHRRGSTWAGTPPPGRYTPLGRDTPPGQVQPPGQVHHPRSSACWEIQATSRWYASYWNAFLLLVCRYSFKTSRSSLSIKVIGSRSNEKNDNFYLFQHVKSLCGYRS